MDDKIILRAYMDAHIRVNGNIPPEEFSDAQARCAFAILPPPKVSFDVFKAIIIGSSEIKTELTTEEKLAHNDKMLDRDK